MKDRVEMLDGRVYETDDNWQTVYKVAGGRRRLIIGKEADLARYIAAAQTRSGV